MSEMFLDTYERKYWRHITVAGIDCAVGSDGLLYLFNEVDIQHKLNQHLADEGGWYFNESKDRYCVEKFGFLRVIVNPSQVVSWFGVNNV